MKKLTTLIVSAVLLIFLLLGYSTNVNSELSQKIVRLHVIANSDSGEDQALKLKVRDAILKSAEISGTKKEDVEKNLESYRKIAQRTIYENGFSYDVDVEYGNFHFPTKHYNGISLPAGSYDAVRIKIGSAEGKNWWCVMFPPLCFVDGTTNSAYAEEKLRASLDGESFDIITSAKSGKFPFEIKFKIVELCGRLAKRDKVYAAARKD